ncbi:MAG: thiol-disulfide isomerase [Acidobacteria bacterium]|nr:MAG: thiol-disulfide isomerase [Acidobacteriota bacterium]
MKLCLTGFVFASAAIVAPGAHVSKATFSKDVAPIVFQRCAGCHRPGEVAPMPLNTYKEVRPWAKAIKERVVARTMPPWLADPEHGSFRNDRRLSQSEIDTIVNWVAAGAPEGDPRELPALPEFERGWQIGKPDMIVDIGEDFDVPAGGVVPYKYFRVATNFTEDKWIEAAEVRPGNRGAVHHVIVFVSEPGKPAGIGGEGGSLLAGYAPGEPPLRLQPGTAKLVKAGSQFTFQVHYTPNGTSYKDRSYVGLRFAKGPVQNRALTGRALNFGFRIPAGDPNYEVKSSWTAQNEVRLVGLMPHMHLRGKDFKYTVSYPDCRQEVILSVPKYNFNWQLTYEMKDPLVLPKGARIDCLAHFDNSRNNPYNPDPAKEVRWGDQTWEEMMIGWFTYVVPAQPKADAALE